MTRTSPRRSPSVTAHPRPWFSVASMFLSMIVGIAVYLFFAEAISASWPAAALYVYGLLAVVGAAYGILGLSPSRLRAAIEPAEHPAAASPRTDAEAEEHRTISASVMLGTGVVAFATFVVGGSEFLRYWSLRYGGFQATGTDYWYWLRFGLSWVLDNATANFGQVYGWSLSDAAPTTASTRALVWGYNILLDLLVVTGAVRQLTVPAAALFARRHR